MIGAMSDDERSQTVAAGRADQRAKQKASRGGANFDRGRLKVGDDWNAIRIIALAQSKPLKAIAEFVENSIDAHAKTITITRGRVSQWLAGRRLSNVRTAAADVDAAKMKARWNPDAHSTPAIRDASR